MTPTTRKTQTTASSASVDVAQKPVGTIKSKQPLSDRDALAVLKSLKPTGNPKTIKVPGVEGVEFKAPKGKSPAKAVSAKAPRRVKGIAPSRTPEARIARRNMRNMLKALTIAADESQDAEVREYAEQRAAALAEKLGLAAK